MRSRLTYIFKMLAPPIVIQAVPVVRSVAAVVLGRVAPSLRGVAMARVTPPEWQWVPEGWRRPAADLVNSGWDMDSIAEANLALWPSLQSAVQAPNPLGAYHATDLDGQTHLRAHNVHMTYGYVLGKASRGKETISVLDWGGGIGQYLEIGRALWPEIHFDYRCKDVPAMCRVGAMLHPTLSFYEDESCLDRTYDLVMAGGSLQYSEDWPAVMRRLARAAARYLYIWLPVVVRHESFVVVQRPHWIYPGAEFLSWVLNRGELLTQAAAEGVVLLREFLYGQHPSIVAAPEQAELRGYLFQAPMR